MPIERIQVIDEAGKLDRIGWLKARAPDITASVMGALLGAHPYMTALKLYMIHSGIEFPEQEESPVLRRGRLLESAVALAVSEQRPNWTIVKNKYYFRDPDLRLGATPDFLIEDEHLRTGILQCKTVAPHVFERDWDDGKEIPFWVVLQALVEMIVTESEFGVVAPLRVDAFDLACPILDVPRHPGAEARIRAAVTGFWNDVEHAREPAPDYGKDAELLRMIAPRAVEQKVIDLSSDNELPALLDQHEKLKALISAYEKRCREIETEVKFKLRDAERALVPGFSLTWKNQHRDEYISPAADFRVLRINKKGAKHG